MGFPNRRQRDRHYAKHGGDCGATTPEEYERLADTFFAMVKTATVHECTRSQGDIIRFDQRTDFYGVLSSSMAIRTFFKAIPCSSIPASQLLAIKLAGRCHKEATNMLYFKSECARW
jgi:hypothetical protein